MSETILTSKIKETLKVPETPVPIEMSFSQFLQNEPPYAMQLVSDLYILHGGLFLRNPQQLRLFCDSEHCNGMSFFENVETASRISGEKRGLVFLQFRCRDCHERGKEFALLVMHLNGERGSALKIGELPEFGERIPDNLLKIFDDGRELFLKGKACETHNLGIGAFIYYRRIVEAHKDKLFDEIIRVSRTLGVSNERLDTLESAKKQYSFKKAIADFKLAIPEALLIEGHNPLQLLHNALSRGVHSMRDDECLKIARDVRIVLTTLVKKVGEVISSDKDLKEAVAQLHKINSAPNDVDN